MIVDKTTACALLDEYWCRLGRRHPSESLGGTIHFRIEAKHGVTSILFGLAVILLSGHTKEKQHNFLPGHRTF